MSDLERKKKTLGVRCEVKPVLLLCSYILINNLRQEGKKGREKTHTFDRGGTNSQRGEQTSIGQPYVQTFYQCVLEKEVIT